MPKIYGLWKSELNAGAGDWLRRGDGAVLHSTYPQAVAAENSPSYRAEVREILVDGKPGDVPQSARKSVRPQSDKMIRPNENK